MSTAAPAIERIRHALSCVTDQLSLLLPALRIVWACLLGLGRITELLWVRKQPPGPAPTQLLATDKHRKHAFMPVEKTELPNEPIFRADTCGEEAPGSHVPPSNPHSPPSTNTSRSPSAPPALPQRDSIDDSPSLSTSHPSSEETPPPFSSIQSRVEATPASTEPTYPAQLLRPLAHSVPPVIQVPVVRHAPDSPFSSSADHPPPPSPFANWTAFIPAGTSKGEYVKKLSSQIVFCGGFSDIFRAVIWFGALAAGPELKQEFALKILRRIGLDGKDEYQALVHMIDRLYQEAMTWIRLQHPNVVPLLGFTIKPLPSLISPWYERGNIRNYLAHHPDANRWKLIYGVAKGLQYLHSRTPRIAHGDIKPANVLINNEGDALLSDFGLATTLGEEDRYTPSHREGGSIRYMAPELLLGVEYRRTCSADVYSFASLAFEVLTGDPPHRRLTTDGQISVFMANSKGPEYPIDDWSKYPELEPIEGILRRCWSRIPDGRPSMKEIVEELSILVQGTDA